ncbi:hypothetical protein LK09_13130 [Microbacterium mangrovi]|uniref:Uncharacterized protein n=1 Tax=Microbacterium mangrovi TaxID=1348253 RepID=A0A0B2A6M0_9MICO|nr:hypothetical protein [Microbacterium mangrovi]KHK97193.1 hypothetical protein LK09_13130 [Microbacterium mangrovi]
MLILSLDGDTAAAAQRAAQTQVDLVPGRAQVSQVVGDDSEHATASFLKRLQAAADLLADHADVVRVDVKQNVDALQHVVTAMQETDGKSADWVRQHTELVGQTAESTTDADVRRVQDAATVSAPGAAGPAATPAQGASDGGQW